MLFSGGELFGAVVHCVIIFKCRISERVFPVVVAEATVVEGSPCRVEKRAVYPFGKAILLRSIGDGGGMPCALVVVCLYGSC